MAGPGTTAAFAYGGGRRRSKLINGQLIDALHDGPDTAQELVAGSPVPYLNALGVDEPLVRQGQEGYLADNLGSILAVIDASGALTTQYAYEPFGRTASQGAPSGNPFQFTARENDGTSLYYYRARYYHPDLGRFISEDPVGLAGGDVNLYGYVGNSPTNFTDPSGYVCLTCISIAESGKLVQQAQKLSGRKNEKDRSKSPLCSVLPEGRVLSLGGGLGAIGGPTGSIQQVVNYNTGEVSFFASGGFQAGWNGVASGSVSGGFIYNLGNSNANFSGPFQNVSVSTSEGPGASYSWAPNGVKVIQGSFSATLVPYPTGTYSYTWTSRPLPAGNVWTNLGSNPISGGDLLLYGVRQLCK